MPSRREKLEAMLQSSPTDQMLRYMLAMELDKEGDTEPALQNFETLMTLEKPYVPAFLMAGQLLTRLGRINEAKSVYQQGIAQAERQENGHAAGEMAGFLASLDA
jgi:tetratricopeptide (TPR) repeat protein